jgi:hypothetical protein
MAKMKNKAAPQNNGPSTPDAATEPDKRAAKWTSADTCMLLDAMEDGKNNSALIVNGSIKADMWKKVAEDLAGLEEEGSARKTAVMCKSKWDSVR